MSPMVINLPSRSLLAVQTKDSFVLSLAKFKISKYLFVSNEYRYALFPALTPVLVGTAATMLFCNAILDTKSEDFVEKIDGFIE